MDRVTRGQLCQNLRDLSPFVHPDGQREGRREGAMEGGRDIEAERRRGKEKEMSVWVGESEKERKHEIKTERGDRRRAWTRDRTETRQSHSLCNKIM